MKLSKFKDRKAISPVIATVILVAVAITIAVAVAYWMGGISSQYTKFEKVEISTAYSVKETNDWKITLALKNSGSADSTLSSVFLNNRPLNATAYNASDYPTSPNWISTSVAATGSTLKSGESNTFYVWIKTGVWTTQTLSSGTTIDLKVHSAGGMDYIKLIELV
jgi:flagellin-like protein